MNGQLELIMFHLNPDADRAHYLHASERATAWLRTRSGFLGREVFEDESGQWIDMVRWNSLDEARAAAEAFMDTREAAAIMDAVDPETINMLHPRSIASYE